MDLILQTGVNLSAGGEGDSNYFRFAEAVGGAPLEQGTSQSRVAANSFGRPAPICIGAGAPIALSLPRSARSVRAGAIGEWVGRGLVDPGRPDQRPFIAHNCPIAR